MDTVRNRELHEYLIVVCSQEVSHEMIYSFSSNRENRFQQRTISCNCRLIQKMTKEDFNQKFIDSICVRNYDRKIKYWNVVNNLVLLNFRFRTTKPRSVFLKLPGASASTVESIFSGVTGLLFCCSQTNSPLQLHSFLVLNFLEFCTEFQFQFCSSVLLVV